MILFLVVPKLVIAEPGPPPIAEFVPVDFMALIPEPVEIPPSYLCNCYAYIKNVYVADLPSTKTILSNLSATGEVAVFYYPEVGLHHYAYVISDTPGGYLIDESNYKNCQQGHRVIDKNDQHLLGFFDV